MRRLQIVVLAVVVSALGGCGFENPLTPFPSSNLNTWLLGVWEAEDANGNELKVTVLPKTESRYWVNLEQRPASGRGVKKYRFEGYISRVGNSNFLTLQALQSGEEFPEGLYTFVHYQLLDQNHLRTRAPQLTSDPSASSFRLRQEVRRGLKEVTLYSGQGLDWTRTSEVYWSGTDEAQPFQPLRYPEPEPDPAEELQEEREATAE